MSPAEVIRGHVGFVFSRALVRDPAQPSGSVCYAVVGQSSGNRCTSGAGNLDARASTAGWPRRGPPSGGLPPAVLGDFQKRHPRSVPQLAGETLVARMHGQRAELPFDRRSATTSAGGMYPKEARRGQRCRAVARRPGLNLVCVRPLGRSDGHPSRRGMRLALIWVRLHLKMYIFTYHVSTVYISLPRLGDRQP
jgi:hypothetical protein